MSNHPCRSRPRRRRAPSLALASGSAANRLGLSPSRERAHLDRQKKRPSQLRRSYHTAQDEGDDFLGRARTAPRLMDFTPITACTWAAEIAKVCVSSQMATKRWRWIDRPIRPSAIQALDERRLPSISAFHVAAQKAPISGGAVNELVGEDREASG